MIYTASFLVWTCLSNLVEGQCFSVESAAKEADTELAAAAVEVPTHLIHDISLKFEISLGTSAANYFILY